MANHKSLYDEPILRHVTTCLKLHQDLVFALRKAVEELEAAHLTNGIYKHAQHVLDKCDDSLNDKNEQQS